MPCILSGECNLNSYDGFSALRIWTARLPPLPRTPVPLLKGSIRDPFREWVGGSGLGWGCNMEEAFQSGFQARLKLGASTDRMRAPGGWVIPQRVPI